jgi:pimeloyl-ACP methyl ester carboxylesterase
MDTLEKYIMIGGPEPHAWRKVISKSIKQFLMSWYIFFFQMPFLPETTLRFYDIQLFEKLKVGSKEDIECFKYTFNKPDAFTAPINYYRALRILYPDARLVKPKKCAPGLFLLGEYDRYISREIGPITQRYLDNVDFKIIKGANHFAQQHKPEETNRMIREFLEKK